MYFVRFMVPHLPPLAICLGCIVCSRRLLHYFQLESYQFYGFYKTCLRRWKQAVLPFTLLGALWFALALIAGRIAPHDSSMLKQFMVHVPAALLIAASALAVSACRKHDKEKKPFVITSRVKRLYAVLACVLLALWLLLPPLYTPIVPIAAPCLIVLSALIALPIERTIARMYMRDAQKRMDAQRGLIRIGITGSYGKTSVKVILNTLLSQKYNVLSTPASFNTPMGLTRVIRERLEPAHQVFLAEMGARHRKDIKELTDFIHPSIGVLTSVGPQHLDTFKSFENIVATKYDLIRALPRDGFAVFHDDHSSCAELYDRTADTPKAIVGRNGGDVWAENLTLSAKGSAFTLCFRNGSRIACQTRLLGAHNITNILLACAVARHLDLNDQQIQRGISLLQPVEHRLQLLPSAGGITVIDDAFNSNPVGTKAALTVLAQFPGRHIVVTPGMVELGKEEADFNRAFGRDMAAVADVSILIGRKHAEPIREGLLSAGYSSENIHIFDTLSDATAWLHSFMQPGDFVLYENDLPDHYSET